MDQMFFNDDSERTEFALKLCDRNSGIGADGILFVQKSNVANAKMRIFNADGSEAAMCGNGLRCVARFLSEKLNKNQLVVETMYTLHSTSKVTSIFNDMPTYSVEILPISLETSLLKMQTAENELFEQLLPDIDETLKFTAISVPNPHLITFINSETDFNKQERIATFLNDKKTIFLDGVNVSFVKIIAPDKLFVKTFERGVGFTNACGTAMAASTYVYHLRQQISDGTEVSVYNPGAMVRCIVKENSIDLIGNATFEFSAELCIYNENKSFEVDKHEKYSSEVNQFALFEENCRNELKKFD
jgi:diaminopimelate epimerase